MIKKEVLETGFVSNHKTVILKDEDRADVEIVVDAFNYSDLVLNHGMTDRDIVEIALMPV